MTSALPVRTTLVVLAAVLAVVTTSPASAQDEEAAAPQLSIEQIVVEPGKPAADTLCRLSVKLGNAGEQTASQLAFQVKLNGQELGVYGNQLFMFAVEPGAENELRLYNFWTTETSRSMPANGKLEVEVTLTEARWMEIKTDDEGVEVWTPQGDVGGLPVSKKITLEMQK
jgi:hypothetical protein